MIVVVTFHPDEFSLNEIVAFMYFIISIVKFEKCDIWGCTIFTLLRIRNKKILFLKDFIRMDFISEVSMKSIPKIYHATLPPKKTSFL